MRRRTLTHLHKLKAKGEKITCLTAYDASFARLIDQAGIDILLVGDSLGMVIQGHDSTLPVTVDDMIYHCQQVYRGSEQALLMVDMPFMSYATPRTALETAARLMGETSKILSPEKRVLMPTLDAECSLDLSCPIEDFAPFCDAHPDHTVVVYANTSAAV
ncbi:MAG TPA: hypothetical protein EYP59_14620, partial [Thiotrichaceae bacterium]|nr:hypothetical protein [Thiotrichaceae bacterium]